MPQWEQFYINEKQFTDQCLKFYANIGIQQQAKPKTFFPSVTKFFKWQLDKHYAELNLLQMQSLQIPKYDQILLQILGAKENIFAKTLTPEEITKILNTMLSTNNKYQNIQNIDELLI